MWLRRLKIQALRALRNVDIEPSPGLNVITGLNGSGKTSFLEAVYILGLGRSFRSRHFRDVIFRQSERLVIFGDVLNEDGLPVSLGIERGAKQCRIRISGEEVKAASALARLLPILLITPDTHRLLTDGARLRRRMLDWALFHVEPTYNQALQRYRRALRQRNAALRGGVLGSALEAWIPELESSAEHLHHSRQAYAAAVSEPLGTIMQSLLGREVSVSYEAGWHGLLRERLADNLRRDITRGYTGDGPHVADVSFKVDGRPAQNVLSRGEGKLFTAALLLAQTAYVTAHAGRVPVILVDDLASELDADNRCRFLQTLCQTGAQVFVTAVAPDLFDISGWNQLRKFHVKHGLVHEMV